MVRVRLTRKLANQINGVDLSAVRVGDHILVPNAVASMLIQEGWAEVISEYEPPDSSESIKPPSRTSERPLKNA